MSMNSFPLTPTRKGVRGMKLVELKMLITWEGSSEYKSTNKRTKGGAEMGLYGWILLQLFASFFPFIVDALVKS